MRKELSWLFLSIFGALSFILALNFRIGSLSDVGSAIYPLILSSIIALISIYSFFFAAREKPVPMNVRALICVSSAVILFILLVERIGLLPSVVLSMFTAYVGQTKRGYAVFLAYACIFAVGTWLLFSYALNLPLPAFRVL